MTAKFSSLDLFLEVGLCSYQIAGVRESGGCRGPFMGYEDVDEGAFELKQF